VFTCAARLVYQRLSAVFSTPVKKGCPAPLSAEKAVIVPLLKKLFFCKIVFEVHYIISNAFLAF
jgi:hypothetical protein